MSWIAIIGWLLMNLPELIALIRRILDRPTLSPVAKEQLRASLSAVISDRELSRKEKRAKVREILSRA